MTERRRAAIFGALAAAWAGAIFWASSRPDPFPFLQEEIFSYDKLLHAAAYALLAGLVAAAFARARLGVRAAAVAVALAVAYGVTDEWHQSRVPGRDADPADVVADAAGAIAGAAAVRVILRGRRARASIRA